MLFEEEDFKARLRGVIESVGCSTNLKEDVQQEVLIHLWQLEQSRPHQTRSWYLQAGRFFARHVVSSGRSIDSGRRASGRVELPDDVDLADEILNPPETRNGLFFSEVSANDIEELLVSRIPPIGRRILAHLRDGHSVRAIARNLGMSHPAVLNHRKKIACVARQLGLGRADATATKSSLLSKRMVRTTRSANRCARTIDWTVDGEHCEQQRCARLSRSAAEFVGSAQSDRFKPNRKTS